MADTYEGVLRQSIRDMVGDDETFELIEAAATEAREYRERREGPLAAEVERRQQAFGEAWEQAIRQALT